MKKQQKQLAAEAQLKLLTQKYEMLRKIITAEGFRQTWFDMLPNYESSTAAFNALNEIYYNLTSPHKYRYSSYKVFSHINSNKHKKK